MTTPAGRGAGAPLTARAASTVGVVAASGGAGMSVITPSYATARSTSGRRNGFRVSGPVRRDSAVYEVWLAIRDGGGLTHTEIADKAGLPATQIGPALWWLCERGWAVPMQTHTELVSVRGRDGQIITFPEGRKYIPARLARHIGLTTYERRQRY